MSRTTASAAVCAAALAAHAGVNARLLRRPPPAPDGRLRPRLSVLIPARNEQATIGACLAAVLASQQCDLEVIVGDDGSTDRTAAVVGDLAATDARLRLMAITPPPAGWLGKPNACQQLADAARHEVLVFVDADVAVEPDGLARTAALLDVARLDLVSPYPRQITVTAAERLVQPLLQWSWLTFLPLRLAERLAAPTLVAANGQLLACRRSAYRAAGGHAAVSGEVIEDVALARMFKRHGFVATVADGTDVARCRMYDGWPQVRDGYTKSLWAATRTPAGAAALAALLTWLYVVPPVALLVQLARRPGGAVCSTAGLAGYAAGVAGRVIAARRTGGRAADGVWHPVSVVVALSLLGRSHLARRRGQLRWKRRTLP